MTNHWTFWLTAGLVIAAAAAAMLWTLVLDEEPAGKDTGPTGPEQTLEVIVLVEDAKRRASDGKERSDASYVEETAATLARRWKILGAREVKTDIDGTRVILRGRGTPKDVLEGAMPGLLDVGRLEFFIEVRPDSEYAEQGGTLRNRPALWTGTTAEFRVYKAQRVQTRRAQQASPTEEGASHNGMTFRVYPKQGKAASESLHDFVLVEVPEEPKERFDGSLAEMAFVQENNYGMTTVVVNVRKADHERLAAFTKRNIGLPLAIVIDGEVLVSPIIQDTIRDTIQITFGAQSTTKALEEAEALALALRGGALAAPVRLVSLDAGPAPDADPKPEAK